MAKGIKVIPKDAEKVRRKLIQLNLLDRGKKVKRTEGGVIFPVKDSGKIEEGLEVVECRFEERVRHKKFKDRLKAILGEDYLIHARTSFDVIGDIAIIEVPEELKGVEKEIAGALLKSHGNIKTVFRKGSGVKKEERVRELKFLAGVRKTETVHKEHGCIFKLDVEKVYFSPRLSHERERILEQTKDSETIVDLFAGVGPFSILLAKNRDVHAYAIDMNAIAYRYLKENIMLNRVVGKVTPLLGDCRVAAPKDSASRVIMNLPKSSEKFLDLAFDVIKEGTIHFYAISQEDALYDSKIGLIRKTARGKKRKINITNKRIVRSYSPHRYHIAVDIKVEK